VQFLWMFTTIALLTLGTPTTRADGLLYQLPDDGAWVRFDMELIAQRDGMETKLKGFLTMSSVGQQTENGEKCRWIEFDGNVKNADGKRTFVAKALIPERYLKKDKKPLDHFVRGWLREADNVPQSLAPPDVYRQGFFPAFLSGPLKDAENLDVELVECKLGKLQCAGVAGRGEYQQGRYETHLTFQIRLHEKAPFGVVSARMECEGRRDGQVRESGTVTLNLAEIGDKATTKLPDYQ